MTEAFDLQGLQLLHGDLLALSESRLLNVERLWSQLENSISEFRQLLEKSPQSEQSRALLSSGKVTVHGTEYAINEEFKQNVLQVASALNLDELDSARLVFNATNDADAETLGRSVVESSIIRFHQRRQYLLECYRLILEQSTDTEDDTEEGDNVRTDFRNAVKVILEGQDTPGAGSKTIRKCLKSMEDIKIWLQVIADKFSSASVLGQTQAAEVVESLEYQRVSLIQQHESLGLIIFQLIKGNHAIHADFEALLVVLRRIDRYDHLLVHYFPAAGMFIATFGSSEASTFRQARQLNDLILGANSEAWALHYVHAAISTWWLGEYSGRYTEGPIDSPVTGVDVDEEIRARSRHFTEALKDGAFDFMLSLSADVKSVDWLDPARHGLRQWLQRKAPPLAADTVPFSNAFQTALMEQLESFVDAFITNMPDVLRRLRTDEDEQRQLSQTHEHDLDLERFLVIISYAFEGRPNAAHALFWADPESNLAGFLQWASRRASTPLMSAFCEMLQALSESEDCANSTHEFLLDEGSSTSSGKMRKNSSLTWSQIFRELKFFTEKIRDRPAIPQSTIQRLGKASNDQAETEPESAMMLESYLRLITRLCIESTAAKIFLLKHPSFQIVELLYQLASSLVPSRLRACVFTTLQSFVSHKTGEESDFIWTSLDVWISGGYSPGSTLPRGTITTAASLRAMNGIFSEIGAGTEESNAFVQLLNALVAPYEGQGSLNDVLPFPETLGSTNRMPGIDPYVDFALKDVFVTRTAEISDLSQLRLLRLTCLDFMRTCLSTFNEDLVVFANRSNVSVDEAIGTSDLTAYVCLHPFARVMEWLFNDKVMATLFDAIHQDPTEVANSSPDSPLLLCLLQAIEVVTLVMDLQSTYLNVVRPKIKLQPIHRRNVVANAAFASFEDGILNHLSIFVDLGLFIGLGHPLLTMAALKLLKKLSISPKLISRVSIGNARYIGRNKAIAALESSGEAENIARAFLNELLTPVDMSLGPDVVAFMIKDQIIDFLNACLEAVTDRPTVAHLLLGFHCGSDAIEVRNQSSFDKRETIFHATLDFVADGLIGDASKGISSSLISIRTKGLRLLRCLWKSPLTSLFVATELRNDKFMASLVAKEPIVDTNTLWDGRSVTDVSFLSASSAAGLSLFLSSRSLLLQYAAMEVRQVSQEKSKSLLQSSLRTMLGSSTLPDGQQIQHSNVFDFFDFMEIEMLGRNDPPLLQYCQEIDLSVCLQPSDDFPPMYELKWVHELLALRKSSMKAHGLLTTIQEDANYETNAQMLVEYLTAANHSVKIQVMQMHALDAWVQLMVIVVTLGGLENTHRVEFILRALQIILPKLEKYIAQGLEGAIELAKLAKFLLFSINFSSHDFNRGDLGELANDRLFEMFRICLRAIHSPIANSSLKEILYAICFRYLVGMSDVQKNSGMLRKQSVHTIKTAGPRLLDVVCDDAYAGESTSRITATLLLGALVDLAAAEKSKFMVESLVRLNLLGLLVDSIKNFGEDLRDLGSEDLDLQLSYYASKLALLLRLSQSRTGAGAVLNAGLFQAIKESKLFQIDPDLGIDVNDKYTVERHYELLLGIMRVINAAVLSCGSQNEQVLSQGRAFLSGNRSAVLTVFKRSARAGPVDDVVPQALVEDLAESYVLLITMTAFLDAEKGNQPPQSSRVSFT